MREKDFFKLDDTAISDAGYKVRVEFNSTRDLKIYMNPLEYKTTGIISFFGDQSSKIREANDGGGVWEREMRRDENILYKSCTGKTNNPNTLFNEDH